MSMDRVSRVANNITMCNAPRSPTPGCHDNLTITIIMISSSAYAHDIDHPNYEDFGAQSLQPCGFRLATLLSTLESFGYPKTPRLATDGWLGLFRRASHPLYVIAFARRTRACSMK